MADLQAEIQAAADEMVASGAETGLQIAVRQHGHVVADVWPEFGSHGRPRHKSRPRHGPHLDQPERFLAELTDHLADR